MTLRSRPPVRLRALGAASVMLFLAAAVQSVALSPAARAADGDIGHQGVSYSGAGDAPTADKPQSKLWFNDGFWWADMFDSVSRTWHIWRLDRSTQTWADTGVTIDDRPNTRGDVLWDGTHLYVASNVLASSSTANTAGQPARLYRYSYSATARSYSLDPGFPVAINNHSSESLTFDKDSRGVLWATWTQGQQVYVNATDGTDTGWGTPSALGLTGAAGLAADDISALAAYGKTRVGLLWSNQNTSTFYFAYHKDGDPVGTWTGRVAVSDPNIADDHLNLKQLEGDDLGHLYAAVKTNKDDVSGADAPQVLVLGLNPNSGTWESAPFDTLADCHTRPQLVIDSVNRVLHVFATAPYSGCPYSGSAGTIFQKTSSLDKLAFPAGRGTPVMRDAASDNLNNVTTTKQSVTRASGLVVLASNDVTRRYWHADVPLSGVSPTVSFTATPASGTAPLPVTFTDTSTGGVTAWSWTFGDGGTSTQQNPSHTYTSAGTYTVTLTATTASGASSTSTGTVRVAAPAAAGTVSFGGASSTGQSTAGTSVTLSAPAGTVAGDVLVASFTTDNGPTATAPAGWTSFVPRLRPAGATLFGYYRVVPADAGPASWTWTLSSAQKWSGGISRYVGVDTTNPLDSTVTTAVATSQVTSLTVPAVTTGTAGALVVGGVGADGTVATTPPTTFTEAWQNRVGKAAASAYRATSQAGSQPATTWSASAARALAAWTVALRPAAP